MSRLLILLLSFSFSTWMSAQHFIPRGVCGVNHESQQLAEKLYGAAEERISATGDRNNVVYVPVKFHLTANNEGKGRVELRDVLNQLCILNTDFAASNMVFYLSGDFEYHDITNMYENPGTSNALLVSKKNPKALNIFVTENADPGSAALGTVLGYYSPQGDYVVVRKLELVNRTNTLSHEVGHFFNLRHTFYGWEGAPYDKNIHGETVTFTTVPNGIPGVQVELMNKSNCNNAADMICDTPPDYNFGISTNSCSFNLTVFDRNNDRVIPMVNNQMSYFSKCDTFRFTDGQTTRMRNNFNASTRSQLRSNYVPSKDTITAQVVIRSPATGANLPVYDGIELDWEDVPGATRYLVEIRGAGQYYGYVTYESRFYATELRRNQLYSWSVRPFNEVYACAPARNATFRTGNGTVSTTEIELVKNVKIFPNPVTSQDFINVEFNVNSGELPITVELRTIDGRFLYSDTSIYRSGQSLHTIGLKDVLNPGIHLLRIITEKGTITKTFTIN
ncbi:MAG: T9SS type A sorting domain-containing protein [Saprospiraceae bacterium]|nr:T9SS type A sorting domain-containing protein [Saprospiraceae bacterium]